MEEKTLDSVIDSEGLPHYMFYIDRLAAQATFISAMSMLSVMLNGSGSPLKCIALVYTQRESCCRFGWNSILEIYAIYTKARKR